MKKIVFTRPDGGVSVVNIPNRLHEGISDEDAQKKAWDRLPPEAINSRWVDEAEILTDRSFRNAWEDTGAVTVNMPKAREIHKDKMRQTRVPKLAALDVEFMRALEKNDMATAAAVATKKQVLRDVTADPAIETAQTPEALIAVWPDILK